MISWTLIYINNLVSIDSSCPPSVYIQLRTWPFFSIQAVTLGAKFTASNYLPNLIWLCRGSKGRLFAILSAIIFVARTQRTSKVSQ